MPTVPPFHPVGFGANLMPASGITGLRFSECEALLAQGGVLIDETGRERIGGADLIVVVQATRAAHTFEAVIALCQIGRGVQAAMLNRSLLEDVLDIHWVAANPEQAPTLADQHERLLNLGERAAFVGAGREGDPLDEDEQREFAALLRTYNNFRKPWNLASEAERRRLIQERWGDEQGDALDFVYEVIQRQNNTLLHGSPTAYRQTTSTDDQGGVRGLDRIGVDRRWRDSLGHGVLGYYFVCRVLAEYFGFDKDPAAEAFQRASCFLKELSPEQVDGLAGDASCPCGSGEELGACHLS